MATTNSGAETVHPTGTPGWAIADAARTKWGNIAWANLSGAPTGLVHVAADE